MASAGLVTANASRWCQWWTLHDACQHAPLLINARIQKPNPTVPPAQPTHGVRRRSTKAVRSIDACTALDKPAATKTSGQISRRSPAKLENDDDDDGEIGRAHV